MPQSRVLRICSVMLAAWWGLTSPLVPGSTAQLQEATKPAAEKPAADSLTAAGDVDKKAAVELTALKEKVRRLKEAFEATKKDFVPRLREAQISVQQATAALQRAVGPDESKPLEDELHMAQALLSLLEREMALAEEEVTVAEGLLMVAEKRAMVQLLAERQDQEDQEKTLTAQDARVAAAEAKVAAEKMALAQAKVETLQLELQALEKEVAESKVALTTLQQESEDLTAKLISPAEGEEKDQLERGLRRSRRRAEILQKSLDSTERQLALTHGKYELAQREHELLTADVALLEARASTIRERVGVSLEDIRVEQEEAEAAQKAAATEKQKAQQEQAAAQRERDKAQQALEQARLAKEQAKTPEQLRLAEITQLVAAKKAELAQKKSELAKEKIDVAERAAEIPQRRLEVTTRKLEAGRKALTATEILNAHEWAKAEVAKASKEAQSTQTVAELARQEMEALRREAELAQLKVQVEKSQLERPSNDAIARATIRALEAGAQVAQDRAELGEERAAVAQNRARLAAEKAQILDELKQLLAVQRSTYQLWKREPSKITWNALQAVATDLVVLRSTLIIGVSTLPEQMSRVGNYLVDPAQSWHIVMQSLTVVLLLLLAVFSAISLRKKLQPLIDRQENVFLPSAGKKLLRAGTRLVAAMALPVMLLLAGLLMLQLVTGGRLLLVVLATALGGFTAYTLLKGMVQELFMPWEPQQRLIACRNGIASYLYRHLRRICAYVTGCWTMILILQAIEYHESLTALLHLLFYVGLLVLLILLTANKEAVLGLLPHGENRLETVIYVVATRVYPLLILLGICIIALQSVGYVNLARFLLTSSLMTTVILAAAYGAGKGMDQLLRWWLLGEDRTEQDFLFGRETAETFYTIVSHTLSYFAYVVALVMIAGTWGVDLSGIYATLTSPTAQDYLQRLLAALLIIIASMLILRTAYFLIDKVFNISPEEARAWRKKIALGDKGKTVAPLLKSVLKYCTIFIAGVLALRALGVDPTPIIAGAGVVGLAVGFGAQTLVKDVIAGFFLLFEGLIAVGDVVTFGNSSGVVEEVGLRVTKYRTFTGELWVIPNGEIRAFGNFNRQWMRAVVPVGIAYEQDVGKAMRVLEEVGKTWAAERRDIVLEPPQVQGILSFDESAVALRLVVKVRALQQGAAELELRRHIKEAFDREGVEIPFPRRALYPRPDTNGIDGTAQTLLPQSKRLQKVEDASTPAEG